MTRANRDRLFAYKGWLNRENENGTPLVAYTCPSCLEKLHTVQAPDSEVWDTFSNCPFCQSLLFKVTKGATVSIELMTKIGANNVKGGAA
ncbi:hypothetical protein DSJ_10880 [Pantoea stewartii subsp. stewartii DC283]|uniref:Uncharacterized protein n=1 Tax=Pantoea stewartii subsp. stewartii DC283 TaxID=660596 RepID=A0ABM6K4M2_PANSE|nr:hypothetical protein DSJ_10880 [Pantoea stewartii subsp. stewartii DC283]KAB0559400.1 hypothetical protein F7Q90_02340 [Pantoea stewartii subsp. stewartii]